MEKSRLALVLCIIRKHSADATIKYPYNQDELLSELYIYVDTLIKSKPFIENEDVITAGMAYCRKYINRYRPSRYELPVQIAKKTRREFKEVSSNSLLTLWCENRNKRQCKKWASRIAAYLHYVESLPCDEIAEIFGKTVNAIRSTVYQVHLPRNKTMLKTNDVVLLVMDNPFFNHMLAWVKEPTEFGAVVEVESHNYPNRCRWTLRVVHSEIVYIGTVADMSTLADSKTIPTISVDGSKKVVSNAQATHKPVTVYTQKQPPTLPNGLHDPNVYSLDECSNCGQMKLRRSGPCMICDACGTSTGC